MTTLTAANIYNFKCCIIDKRSRTDNCNNICNYSIIENYRNTDNRNCSIIDSCNCSNIATETSKAVTGRTDIGSTYLFHISKKFKSFKSKEKIHKKEVWPYHGFGVHSIIINYYYYKETIQLFLTSPYK